MRVLVTGGAGFIGSHIVDDLLAAGHEVLVVDDLSTGKMANLPGSVELAQVDIAGPRFLEIARRFKPEAITHCAAQASVVVSMAEPIIDATTNILGGLQVLKAAIETGCPRFVYITTGGALYGHPLYTPSDEGHPIRPISPYGLSKWTLEGYASLLLPESTPPRVLRLANIYGPRQDPNGEAGVIAIFGSRMLGGQPVTIYGDGEQTRDFVYVGDVVRAHALALALPAPRPVTINRGTMQPTSVNELFRVMATETGYTLPAIHAEERRGEIKHVTLDNLQAKEALGWEPRTGLQEGIKATIDWLRQARVAAGVRG
jgi:UDP-glucose 4-epimerase